MKTDRTISLFIVLGLATAIPVRPDSYQDRELGNIKDQDLLKFYEEFYDQEDDEGIPLHRKSTIDEYLDYPEEHKDDVSIPSSKNTKKISTKQTQKENSNKLQPSSSLSVGEKDPTFVLSKLLFHLSQLPL